MRLPAKMAWPQRRIRALRESVIEREYVELRGFDHEPTLEFAQLLRLLGGEVIRLGKVLLDVVKLPGVLVEADAARRDPGRLAVETSGDPSVVVERAVAEHLEVLRDTAARRLLRGEGVGHADSLDRPLADPVHHARFGDAGHVEDRRGDVDDMMKLRAHSAFILDALRPGHDQSIAGAAEVRGNLLHPLEGRGSGPAP